MQITRSLKFGAAFKLMLAAGIVSSLAACGGSDTPVQSTTLTVAGTALTGAAIDGGDVSVVCVNGTGTALKNVTSAGAYSVVVTGTPATGPCVVTVTRAAVPAVPATANTAAIPAKPAVSLRSVASIANGVGTANVNQLTELLVVNIINRSTDAAKLTSPAAIVQDAAFKAIVNDTISDNGLKASVRAVSTAVTAGAVSAGVPVDADFQALLDNFLTAPIAVNKGADLGLDTIVATTAIVTSAAADVVTSGKANLVTVTASGVQSGGSQQ
jgi:hypothetical protein